MTTVELYEKGYLGIQLKPGIEYLLLEGEDEDGKLITQKVTADRIYQVTYLSFTDRVGLFEIDEENSCVFQIDEAIWDFTSTYSDVYS